MEYQTLLIKEIPNGIEVVLNRVSQRNALNALLITELLDVLNQVDNVANIHIIVLKGQQGFFCTGMDFNEAVHSPIPSDDKVFATHYMTLLKCFASSKKILIAAVDGQVLAGGVGIVAASDIVLATPTSQFGLSEALWGLLPANVIPYLIRRIGFQKAYFMTLTTQSITAAEAHNIYLVDDLTENLDETIRKYNLRLSRLNEQTIHDLKSYFRKMWLINENMENTAIEELARLMREPRITGNLKRYVEEGKFPWETL